MERKGISKQNKSKEKVSRNENGRRNNDGRKNMKTWSRGKLRGWKQWVFNGSH